QSNKSNEDVDEEFEEDDSNYTTVNNKIKNSQQQNIASDTYSLPDEEEESAASELNTVPEEDNQISLPLNVNTIKSSANFIQDTDKEIELTIDPPAPVERQQGISPEPELTVERVIEEKPISA